MFLTVNNEEIFVDRVGDKTSPTKLLFVHGASSYGSFWLPIAARLTSFDCILIDLPGHYRSNGEARTSVSAYAAFVERFITEFFKNTVTSEEHFLIYVGHSLGGAIGQELAIANPPWMQKLILINTEAKITVPQSFLNRLAAGDYDTSYLLDHGFSQNAKPSLKAALQKHHVVSIETSYRDFYAGSNFDRQHDVANIHIPTLILAGEDDGVTPATGSTYLHEQIQHSIYVPVPGTGHFLPLEDPRTVVQNIRTFIT